MESEIDVILHVRDATGADVEALVHIKPPAILHYDRMRDAGLSYMRYLVLERGGQIIGFACLVFNRPPNWSDAGDTTRLPQVVDVQIEPALRGKGYGSFLLRSVERIAVECGYGKLFLAVDPKGNARAHALYLRCGYRPIQPEPHLVHWEFVDSEGNQYMGDGWAVDMVKGL